MNYLDADFDIYFERRLEEFERRRKIERIPIDSLPEIPQYLIPPITSSLLPRLTTSDVIRLIEAIPPQLIQKKILMSENERMILDLENGQIIIKDDTTNRVLLDGATGKFKISKEGVDVKAAAEDNLLFTSDWGSVLEYYYPVSDHRWMTATDWIYAGPWNPQVGRYEAIPVTLTGSDFKKAKVYFEAVFGGPAGVVSHARLYNITQSKAVTNSEISFTPTFGECSSPIRSGEIILDEGKNTYACQQKRSGGTSSDFPSVVRAQIVVRIKA